MLAVTAMTAQWQAIFFAIALVLLVVAAFKTWAPSLKVKIDLMALGLAVFVFVYFWQALASS